MLLKSKLQGHRIVRVFGSRYVIRKINPLLDFPYDKVPQIFSSFYSKRPKVDTSPHPANIQKTLDDMKSIVAVGIVKPELIPMGKGEKRGKEDGITVDDLFVDIELGSKLYLEIIAHSLNRFRGLKGLFFSIKIRQLLFTEWQKNMGNDQLISSLQTVNIQ